MLTPIDPPPSDSTRTLVLPNDPYLWGLVDFALQSLARPDFWEDDGLGIPIDDMVSIMLNAINDFIDSNV